MISKFDESTEFYTGDEGEKCFIVEIHNTNEDENCSVARARVKPGVTTQRHSLSAIEERYVILSGEGEVTLGDKTIQKVKPLDVILIPADMSQKIKNTHDSVDLIFLCICTPKFRYDAYNNLEA